MGLVASSLSNITKQPNGKSSSSTMNNSSLRHSTSTSSHNQLSPPSNAASPSGKSTTSARNVCITRSIFLLGLALVGAGLSVASYFILQKSETSQAVVRLEGIADRALTTSREIVQRKRLGVATLADTVAWSQPKASAWPFVSVAGYEVLATNIIQTSKSRTMGFCPFVTPDQRLEWENFAYDYFDSREDFANTTGISPFGKGMWQKNKDGTRVPVNPDANTTWGSPNRIFAPILQHNDGDKVPVHLLNVNFEPTRGVMVDDMIACSQNRTSRNTTCGVLTDMIKLASTGLDGGPDAIMMEPIYPALEAPNTLVGFITSTIVWREALENVFPEDVSGIDCVLRTPNQVFTFFIQDGVAYVKGEGDLHDQDYDEYHETIDLVTEGDFYGTVNYVLCIYPTQQFFEDYSTNNPVIGLIGAIAIILVISLLFYLYDCFVRQEMDATQELLEAKRRFVRFVSHEVRTPLNTVVMGLTVLQEDIRKHSGRTILPPHFTETQRMVAKQQEEENLPDTITVQQEDATEWLGLSEEVLGNTQAAVNVLNDLLNYDKIQRGKLSLELAIIPIWTLVEKTLREFNLMAAEKDIQLHMIFDDNLLASTNTCHNHSSAMALRRDILQRVVVGDVSRISMMLRNLLSNALKFTSAKGSLTVQVKVVDELQEPTAQRRKHSMNLHKPNPDGEKTRFDLANGETILLPPSQYIDIRVIDTGVGMTREQLKTVFHDGVQFGANKLQGGGGSGLGMFIAKSIVEQHGGTLSVESEGIGLGTTFIAKLPLYFDPTSTPVNLQPHTDLTESSTTAPPLPPENFSQHILVVDDAAPNRKLLVRLLKNRGHTCDSAEDGQEALDYVKRAKVADDPYDTIILDYEMPNMDGPTACREMRLLGCSSFITGVTGNLLPEDVAHFKKCGANAVLPKPFKMGSLEELWVEYGVTSARNGNHVDYAEEESFKDESMNGSNRESPKTASISMETAPLEA